MTKTNRAIILAGIFFVVLQAADAFLTIWAVGSGYTEINPLMASLIRVPGPWILPLVKIIPTAMAVWLIFWMCRKWSKVQPLGIFAMMTGTGFYFGVLFHNLSQI